MCHVWGKIWKYTDTGNPSPLTGSRSFKVRGQCHVLLACSLSPTTGRKYFTVFWKCKNTGSWSVWIQNIIYFHHCNKLQNFQYFKHVFETHELQMLPILSHFKGYMRSQEHLSILKAGHTNHDLKITILHIFLIWPEILAQVRVCTACSHVRGKI